MRQEHAVQRNGMKYSGLIIGGMAAGWCAVAAVAAAPQKTAAPVAKAPAAPQPAGAGEAVSPEAAEFFEKNVRPVLAENCYSCHGPKLQQAGLRLDARAFMLKGTDTGKTVLAPGNPDKSALLTVLHFNGAVKMPPQGKLPDKAIQALTEWVKMGAPWPGGGAAAAEAPADKAKSHWAFQPVRNPKAPAVRNKAWVKSPIDAFVLQKLEAKSITPARPTDRRTLIRRAYYDLTGLPPTAEQIQRFIDDKDPHAFAKVVDELLASPRYGERWGRYWLDIARYADTKGYVFVEDRNYPYAYTYRDYVIRSFNNDLPYDQFLIQQLAADQLPLGDDKRPLAAMGFLTLGRRFLNNIADITDDRLDVVFRGTQALTVGCARCHDHKFDPIPTKDYYSLYGVFVSSHEPAAGELPLLADPAQNAEYTKFEAELNKRQDAVNQYFGQQKQTAMAKAYDKIVDSFLAAREAAQPGADMVAVAQKRDLPAFLVTKWHGFLDTMRKQGHHPVYTPWLLFSDIPDAEWASKAPAIAQRIAANTDKVNSFNPLVAQLFAGPAPANIAEVAERYAKLLKNPGPDDQLRHALDSIGCPLNIEGADVEKLFDRAQRDQLLKLRQQVDQYRASSPVAPPRAMVLVDNQSPVDPHVFLRGNPNNPGPATPRQFLQVLSGPERKPFQKGSGRLEMAQAIASKDNPLTARVMVNRVWMLHFGSPLVRTPSDFGLRSDPPTNPELLDYLASQFMENGWSIKKLHRLIMLSSTYQQSSDGDPKFLNANPDNSLYWHFNRRRLDFESTRDSILDAAGALDLKQVGGKSVDILAQPFTGRRSVYAFIDRQNLPNLFRMFDYASPDQHSPMRFTTTVPQQALFLMNSPFLVDMAKKFAARPEVVGQSADEAKVRALYEVAYQRAPEPDELALALRFVKSVGTSAPEAGPDSAWQYGWGTLDEARKTVQFNPFKHFTGSAWQSAMDLPNGISGWASVTAVGGHPGNDLAHAAIRRWVAPQDGVYAVSGNLAHRQTEGDGVRGRVVAHGQVLGEWVAQNGVAKTPVERVELKKGQTLDFIVDCRTGPNNDSFQWAPSVRQIGNASAGDRTEWRALSDFSGPKAAATPETPWEKLAQVLLMSNEFAFVD